MSHFCLLSRPEEYAAESWDLVADAEARAYWLDHFASHFDATLQHALAQYGRPAGKRIDAARERFAAVIEKLRQAPDSLPDGKLSVMRLCRLREKALRDHDLPDPFGHIKKRENASAVEMYPDVVQKLHSMPPEERWLHVIQGVFAGNIFDLGSAATMHLAGEATDFVTTAEELKPRPWLVDDFDTLAEGLLAAPPMPWTKAVVFADNAGCDFVLGMMPMIREMALEGTTVVLAANEQPSLNDITADEAVDVIERLAALDPDLDALIVGGMLEVVSSGNDIPLIDFSEVSDELNAASGDADLVVVEGMGRAIESNFDTEFKVSALRLALLKDEEVARRVGGNLYDAVCAYTAASA